MEPLNSKALSDMHDKAMEYAGLARLAKMRGERNESLHLFRQAFDIEQQVALEFTQSNLEPTRSVLLRSAASLAYCSGLYQDAIRLITTALEGKPPAEIAEELQELWNQVFVAMREKSAGD